MSVVWACDAFKSIVALCLVGSIAGCGTINLVTGLSYDAHPRDAFGGNPIAEVGVEAQAKKASHWWFFWRHNSSWVDGPPWNDNPDRASDRFGFEHRFPLRK